MTGSMEQQCKYDQNQILRYAGKLEGFDNNKILTLCVTEKQWRGI